MDGYCRPRISTGRSTVDHEHPWERWMGESLDAAVSPTEAAVIRIWSDLGVAPGSVDDDFFDLGGRPGTLARFVERVAAEYGVHLPPDRLYATDLTVAVAAHAIEGGRLDADDEAATLADLADLDRV
jgi:hypothetical protein